MDFVYSLIFYVVVKCKDNVEMMKLEYDDCHEDLTKEKFEDVCKGVGLIAIEGCVKHYNFTKEDCIVYFIEKEQYEKFAGESEHKYEFSDNENFYKYNDVEISTEN